ncbi:MAG: hypothetical protein QG621_611 [Patescibacteria group bacterium]|nr:hypothetical protein [Patescibacteria group bacterium]
MAFVIPADLVHAVDRFTVCPMATPLYKRLIAYAHALQRAKAHAAEDDSGILRRQVTDRAVCIWTELNADPAKIEAAKELAAKLEKRYLH